jgi:predicted DNA binding CopG/RHH family protein
MGKSKIEYGTVDVPEEAFEPKNVKWRVTMFVSEDVLIEAKKRAAAEGIGYQTLLNRALRESFFGKAEDERIRKIVREEMGKAS